MANEVRLPRCSAPTPVTFDLFKVATGTLGFGSVALAARMNADVSRLVRTVGCVAAWVARSAGCSWAVAFRSSTSDSGRIGML